MSAVDRSRGNPLPLFAVALLGALIGFLASRQAPTQLLHREASGPEAPLVVVARTLSGHSDGTPTGATNAPLYAQALAALGGGQADGVPAARARQWVALGFLLPLLSGLAARRAFGGTRGPLLAALLALLPGAVWLQAGSLLPYGLQAVLGLIALNLALRWPTGAGAGALRGVLLGLLLVLARLAGAAWAPFVWALTLVHFLFRRRWSSAAALALGGLLILPAPGLLNRAAPVPYAAPPLFLGGIDAALGFHDGAAGIEPRRGDRGPWRWYSARDLSLQADTARKQRTPGPALSAYWSEQARRWALGHPLAALGLVLRKSFIALSGYDPPSPDSLGFRASRVLPWARPLLPLAALLTGWGLVGLWLARRGAAPARPDTTGAQPAPAADFDGEAFHPLLFGTLLAAAFFVARSGDRLTLLLALSVPAAYALDRVIGATTPQRLRALPLLLGAPLLLSLPWLTVAPRAESAADDRYLLASVLARQGQGKGAEVTEELEAALRLDPKHALARLALASALAQDGLVDEGRHEAERVTAEQPGLAPAWRLLALLEERNSRFEESARAYLKLIELDPLNAEAYNNLGTVYVTLVRYDDAVAAFRKALEVDPNYVTAQRNLDEVVKRGPEGIKGGRPSSAAPADGMAQIQAGVSAVMQALQSGQVTQAETILQQLRVTYGSTPDIDFAAGTIHLQKGELPQAIALYERCREAMPRNPYLLNNLAAAYARSGQRARAVPLWEQVLKLDPTNDAVRKNLATAAPTPGGQ